MRHKTNKDINRMIAATSTKLGGKFYDDLYIQNCVAFQILAEYLGSPENLRGRIYFDDGAALEVERRKHPYTALPKGAITYEYCFAHPRGQWAVLCSAVWRNGVLCAPVKAHARFRAAYPDSQETRQAFLDWLNGGPKVIAAPTDDDEA